jgi:hypothetical protein
VTALEHRWRTSVVRHTTWRPRTTRHPHRARLAVLALVAACSSLPAGAATAPSPASFAVAGADSGCPSTACTSVVSLVQSSVTMKRLPSNLTPSLSSAPRDLVAPQGGTTITLPVTGAGRVPVVQLYGPATDTSEIAVLGDSHALMWSTSLHTIASGLGDRLALMYRLSCYVTLTSSQLPPVAGLKDPSRPAFCQNWTQAAVTWLASHPPTLLVIVCSIASNQTTYLKGITSIVTQMQALGVRVELVGSLPKPTADPPECLASYPSTLSLCMTKISKAVHASDLTLEQKVASTTSAGFVNPVPWACTTATCPDVIGDYEAYTDENHFTSTFAASLAPVLSIALGLTPSS